MKFFRYQQKKIAFQLFLSLIVFPLTGCIDLSGSRSTYIKIAEQQSNSKTRVSQTPFGQGEVHTMRGGLGIFSIGMNQLRDAVDTQYKIPSYSTMWYNAGDVSRSIINSYHQAKKT